MLPRKAPSHAARAEAHREKSQKKLPELDSFVKARDWSGALGLLQFQLQSAKGNPQTSYGEIERLMHWVAYCSFHLGEYQKALDALDEMLKSAESSSHLYLYRACCLFYLGLYKEAELEAKKGPPNALQNRLLFHLAHKLNDDTKLMVHHNKLTDTPEDQLTLASIHYLRSHYQEATDIYKRLLLENRESYALNVYVALCYYKLDYFDVSLEILQTYLQHYPESAVAINLKACNHFRLYNGKQAEAELKVLADKQEVSINNLENPLFKHNLVVFRGGENALQILPPLIDIIPEAKLNLVIYHLRCEEFNEAYNLIKDLEPSTPEEYILKGVVNACIGQLNDNKEMVKIAQQSFQLVGASASHCDTIPGRECMAMCFYLLRQFDDVLIYLKSIKEYVYNDDDFNYNYGIAKAATGHFKDAEDHLMLVQNDRYKAEFAYISWLCRCYIMNNKPRLAWDLYIKMEATSESLYLLQLIANDCYKMGHFFFSLKAFDVLERMDPSLEYWEGKRGSSIGAFQQIIAGRENKDFVRDIIAMLKNTTNPQAEYVLKVIRKWGKENGMKLP